MLLRLTCVKREAQTVRTLKKWDQVNIFMRLRFRERDKQNNENVY